MVLQLWEFDDQGFTPRESLLNSLSLEDGRYIDLQKDSQRFALLVHNRLVFPGWAPEVPQTARIAALLPSKAGRPATSL